MKTAISTACFYLKEETENAFPLIKETGVKACAVHLQTFYEYRPEFAKRYAPNLGGVEVCSIEVGAQNFEPQLFSPSRRVRGDGFYWLEQVLRSSQLLGAKRYVLKAPSLSTDDNFEDRLQYLSAIFEFCASYGIELCIENSPLGLFNSPQQIQKIQSACPQIQFSLNAKHASETADFGKGYLKATAGSLAQVVIEKIDLNLIKQLKKMGFEGEIILKTQNFEDISKLKGIINQINSLL